MATTSTLCTVPEELWARERDVPNPGAGPAGPEQPTQPRVPGQATAAKGQRSSYVRKYVLYIHMQGRANYDYVWC